MSNWLNDDGLYIKYGTSEGEVGRGGANAALDPFRTVELVVDLAELSATETIMDDNVVLPAGAVIEEVTVISEVAAVGGTDLDVGLIATDRSTEIDYNGLVAALVTASMNVAGEKNNLTAGVTSAGALIGTALASTGHISMSVTGTYTAGRVVVRVKYYTPVPAN